VRLVMKRAGNLVARTSLAVSVFVPAFGATIIGKISFAEPYHKRQIRREQFLSC